MAFAFLVSSLCLPARAVWADPVTALPVPGTRVDLSLPLSGPMLSGLKVNPDQPFELDFLVNQTAGLSSTDAKGVSNRQIKYFLAALTIPESELWVNLSPFEKDRIIPKAFGNTEMGRDLLAQDYILKQITASVIYPESRIGKEFWAKVYAEASKRYGTSDIPVDTFNKVWIVPDKAVVYEKPSLVNGQAAAYVVESKLKVMLDIDYKGQVVSDDGGASQAQSLTRDIMREVVIPILEKEVNEGGNFIQLRQVYQALILATWYKRKVKESLLARAYVDRAKTNGVQGEDPAAPQKIWSRYVEAFNKGAYNYIKEERDTFSGEVIPRKYVSGGVSFFGKQGMEGAFRITPDRQDISRASLDRAMSVHARFDLLSGRQDMAQSAVFLSTISPEQKDLLAAPPRLSRAYADAKGFLDNAGGFFDQLINSPFENPDPAVKKIPAMQNLSVLRDLVFELIHNAYLDQGDFPSGSKVSAKVDLIASNDNEVFLRFQVAQPLITEGRWHKIQGSSALSFDELLGEMPRVERKLQERGGGGFRAYARLVRGGMPVSLEYRRVPDGALTTEVTAYLGYVPQRIYQFLPATQAQAKGNVTADKAQVPDRDFELNLGQPVETHYADGVWQVKSMDEPERAVRIAQTVLRITQEVAGFKGEELVSSSQIQYPELTVRVESLAASLPVEESYLAPWLKNIKLYYSYAPRDGFRQPHYVFWYLPQTRQYVRIPLNYTTNEASRLLTNLFSLLRGNEFEADYTVDSEQQVKDVRYWSEWEINHSRKVYRENIHPAAFSAAAAVVRDRIRQHEGSARDLRINMVDIFAGDGEFVYGFHQFLSDYLAKEGLPMPDMQYWMVERELRNIKSGRALFSGGALLKGKLHTIQADLVKERLTDVLARAGLGSVDLLTSIGGGFNYQVVSFPQAEQLSLDVSKVLAENGRAVVTGFTKLLLSARQFQGLEAVNMSLPQNFVNGQFPQQMYILKKQEQPIQVDDNRNNVLGLDKVLVDEMLQRFPYMRQRILDALGNPMLAARADALIHDGFLSRGTFVALLRERPELMESILSIKDFSLFLDYAKGDVRNIVKEVQQKSMNGLFPFYMVGVVAKRALEGFLRAFNLRTDDVLVVDGSNGTVQVSGAAVIPSKEFRSHYAGSARSIAISTSMIYLFKYLLAGKKFNDQQIKAFRGKMGLEPGRKLLVCSIFSEETEIARVLSALKEFPKRERPLLVAGFKMNKAGWRRQLAEHGLSYAERTQEQKEKDHKSGFSGLADGAPMAGVEVVLLTSQDELLDFMAVADAVILGADRNYMEPVSQGVPTVVLPGEVYDNRDVLSLLLRYSAVMVAEKNLSRQLENLIGSGDELAQLRQGMRQAEDIYQNVIIPANRLIAAFTLHNLCLANDAKYGEDWAMSTRRADSKLKGGIDLNQMERTLKTEGSGRSIEFKVPEHQLKQMLGADGLNPVILNLQPVRDVSSFLELN